MPAFFADRPISALASSISLRIRVETSAIALCTSMAIDVSSSLETRGRPMVGTLWATGTPPRSAVVPVIVAHPARRRVVTSPGLPLAGPHREFVSGGGQVVLLSVLRG